jgi:hypothetical protein
MSSLYCIQDKIKEIIQDEIEEAKKKILDRTTSLISILVSREKTKEMKADVNAEKSNVTFNLKHNTISSMFDRFMNEKKEEKEESSIKEIINQTDLLEDIGSVNEDEENDSDLEENAVFEIKIDGETYFVADDEPSHIFEKRRDGSAGDCVGVYKNDKAYIETIYKGNKAYYCVQTSSYHIYIDDNEAGDIIN